MNNTYYILRHGQTAYQMEKRGTIYPWPESSPVFLTEEGEKQAQKAAEELKGKSLDLIYSSDASRTRQTAEIVNKELGLEIIFDPRLRDVNAGIYNGRPEKDLLTEIPRLEERLYKRPSQGENWIDVQKRMIDFLKDIDKKHKNRNILIVSHKGPLWFLEVAVKGWDEESLLEVGQKGLATAQFKKLEIDHEL